ncbi:DUF1127 domain-containing protein [Alsobacter sp. KACC 23698]|uniref:DUF1127 domain-containing protein n=1 Tax=Alsobacter sp. KACC 23698 TaxID=3149229 RepID=A0AAU7JFP4_9HYPH
MSPGIVLNRPPRGLAASRPTVTARSAISFGRIAALSLRALGWPARYVAARRNLAILAAMSDLQLRDIGLTRSDIRNVTALPRDEDPTPLLADIVQERRRRRRA